MLDAVSADFRRLPGVAVVTLAEQGRFHETAASCDWTLVIAPEFDDHLRGLSQAVLDAGGRLLGSMPAAIALTGDKLATAAFWHERGVRHPRTEPLDPERFASFAPPWVMKPRFGAGSQATFLVRSSADGMRVWSPAFHECPEDDFIVQEYVRGQPASVALLIAPSQTIPLMPARQHLSCDGRFRYHGGSLPLPPALAERAIQVALTGVAEIVGLQGYVGVDLVLGDAGDDCAIEINPRLTTSYIGLRQLCRGNLAELMLKCAHMSEPERQARDGVPPRWALGLRHVPGEAIETPQWDAGEVRFRTGG
jgi:hypothetical protein